VKTVKKNVYYCEFCKKRGLSASAMSVHEKHCTNNPNRECRHCDNVIDLPALVAKYKTQAKIEEIPAAELDWNCGDNIRVISCPKIEDIQKDVEYCPTCTLAILRQAGLTWWYFKKHITFDYKTALQSHWSEINQNNLREGY
jgi:hypothetical protein